MRARAHTHLLRLRLRLRLGVVLRLRCDSDGDGDLLTFPLRTAAKKSAVVFESSLQPHTAVRESGGCV